MPVQSSLILNSALYKFSPILRLSLDTVFVRLMHLNLIYHQRCIVRSHPISTFAFIFVFTIFTLFPFTFTFIHFSSPFIFTFPFIHFPSPFYYLYAGTNLRITYLNHLLEIHYYALHIAHWLFYPIN